MRLRTVAVGLAFATALAVQASPGFAQSDKIRYRFCNGDGGKVLSFAYANYNLSVATTSVYGWENIPAGGCEDVWLANSRNWTHHFVFFSNGNQIRFNAPGLSWVKQSDESFCIQPKRGFHISETIFSSGRAKECRGDEVLTSFTFTNQSVI